MWSQSWLNDSHANETHHPHEGFGMETPRGVHRACFDSLTLTNGTHQIDPAEKRRRTSITSDQNRRIGTAIALTHFKTNSSSRYSKEDRCFQRRQKKTDPKYKGKDNQTPPENRPKSESKKSQKPSAPLNQAHSSHKLTTKRFRQGCCRGEYFHRNRRTESVHLPEKDHFLP